jgi:uncharacterized protein YndB with AHSA1/START domain
MGSMVTSGTALVTLPSETQIQITREFDAPRHLVYRAWTTPELIERWWSGKRGEVTVADVDLRVGGSWRYLMTANEGFEVGFHGEFREIVPNERIVNTEIYDTGPGAEEAQGSNRQDPTTFNEVGGRTLPGRHLRNAQRRVRGAESGMDRLRSRWTPEPERDQASGAGVHAGLACREASRISSRRWGELDDVARAAPS